MVRTAGKRALEIMAVRTGLDRLGRRLRHGRVTVLAYHNVVPDSAPRTGDVSLHLPVRTFSRQLDLLCAVGRVLSLKELLAGVGDENRNPKAFAITFDDGYRGAVTLGVRELERRGLPATIFVAPALLGDQTFWWDALQTPPEDGREPELRKRILSEGDGTLEAARRLAGETGVELRSMPEYARSANDAELEEATRVSGITIASHTWSHASLLQLSGDALSDEVARPREWLRNRFGASYVDVLSYPYGFHSAPVRRAAREAGYRAGFVLEPGSVKVTRSRILDAGAFRWPRNNVPAGLSLNGFRVRTAWA